MPDGFAARLPSRDARLYPFVFQSFPEPVCIIATICQQGRRAGVVADLACSYEEADRAPIGIGYGMQLGVHATPCAADQTAPLVAWPPFFDRRLFAVRCAFR